MARARGRALVIDGDASIRRGVARALAEREIEPLTAEDGASGLALLQAQPVDVALIDAGRDGAGLDVAQTIAREHPTVALVLLAPESRPDATVEAAWSLGADAIRKPLDPPSIAALGASRAIERRRAAEEARAHAERSEKEIPVELSGVSASLRGVIRLASEAARTSAPVLVTAEEGAGRDRLARLVHDRSRRSARAFVTASCAALADDPSGATIFGAETAGHVREGLADMADRGTLFLDGIEALSLDAQDRLLVLLSRGEIVRAASGARAVADVRVIAGSAIDLRERVRKGEVREELYYRLRTLELHLPPLRDRVEDIPMLAFATLRSIREETGRDVRRISPEALRLLRHHPWPGNARELASVLAHAAALARSDVVSPADLPFSPKIPSDPPGDLFDDELASLPYVEARRRAIEAFERRYTRVVIAREAGNLSGAARRAGMDRSNFKRLVRRTAEDRPAKK